MKLYIYAKDDWRNMSDFLANFDKKNYKKTVEQRDEKKKEPVKEPAPITTEEPLDRPVVATDRAQTVPEETHTELEVAEWAQEISDALEDFDIQPTAASTKLESELVQEARQVLEGQEEEADFASNSRSRRTRRQPFEPDLLSSAATAADEAEEDDYEEAELVASRSNRSGEEETEIDPTYKKRQKRKIILITVASIVSLIVLFWGYYAFTHVKMPDFTGKSVSEARTWATENKVKIDLEQEYDFEQATNTVIKQSVKAGKQVKKKGTVTLTGSLGPDPEDVIPLPDFATMSKAGADEWVLTNKAENLSVMEEYSDKVEKGQFVRQEINNKDVTAETYKRKDTALIFYSKGKEVFEKDIAVPDFKGKPRSEVETWVKTNEIKMEYKKVDSDTVDDGMIVSQSIKKGQKVAKRDSMSVEVSTGKAVTIPNFADYTPQSATSVEGLEVTVKNVFSEEVPYGQLIAQSIEAGEKVSSKTPVKIRVTYSEGQPYLRSYYGQLEGDLEKAFYEDYKAKGANITFTTYFIDAPETRGTVVKMSAYNQYVPLTFTVSIGISNGSLANSNPTSTPSGSGEDEEHENHEAADE